MKNFSYAAAQCLSAGIDDSKETIGFYELFSKATGGSPHQCNPYQASRGGEIGGLPIAVNVANTRKSLEEFLQEALP